MPHALYRRNDLGDPSSVRISGKVRTVPPALTRDGERPLNGRRIEPPSSARRSRRGRGGTRRSERSSADRKSVVEGKSVSVDLVLAGGLTTKNKKTKDYTL